MDIRISSQDRLPLLPEAQTILLKYEGHPNREITGQLLPVLSNLKMNAYLKKISDLCEIKKELSYHIAPHSFATTLTLGNGVPIETVSKKLVINRLSKPSFVQRLWIPKSALKCRHFGKSLSCVKTISSSFELS